MTTALVPIALNGLSRLLQIWSRSLYLSQDHCVCLITVTCVVEMSYADGQCTIYAIQKTSEDTGLKLLSKFCGTSLRIVVSSSTQKYFTKAYARPK